MKAKLVTCTVMSEWWGTSITTVQYRPRALQHLHARKLRAMWRISMKNPCKKLACKFLHELLHADFLHAKVECIFKVIDFPYKNTRKLRVTAFVADIN